MKHKHLLSLLVCVLALAGGLSGCQSSKIAYGNSYYFKQTPRPVAAATDKVETQTPAYASTQAEAPTRGAEELLTQAEQHVSGQVQVHVQRMKELAKERKNPSLTRAEKRANRRELKQEIRSLAKEYRNMSPEAKQEIDKNLRLALIFFGVAVILSIISTVAATSALWILSSIAWVVGVVFLILWLVDELG